MIGTEHLDDMLVSLNEISRKEALMEKIELFWSHADASLR